MSRSSNGRSSIYLGADGQWHGWVTVGSRPDGAADRRHRMAPTRAELTVKVRELERLRDAGQLSALGPTPTVAEWLRVWLETIAPRTASRSTIETVYRPRIERWIIPRIGGHRLDRVRPEHLDALYLDLAASGLSSKSVLMVHQILGRAYRMAMRRGIVGRNITTFVDPPRHREPEMSPLTAAEARRILAAAAEVPNSARWSVALALGLRQSEALGLRWQHVDLDRQQIRVFQLRREPYRHGCEQPAACAEGRHRDRCGSGCTAHARYCPQRLGGEWGFHEPKGGKARTIVLPAPLADQLAQHRIAQDELRTAAGPLWQERDLVFTQAEGRHLGPEQDWQAWKDLLKAAGVRDARLHEYADLRVMPISAPDRLLWLASDLARSA